MVHLEIEVDDWDTEETLKLTLPCDVSRELDLSHEHLISYWDSDMALGFYDDVLGLNNVIDSFNSANPNLTLKILEEILDASEETSLSSSEFVRKICDNDYMLEEVFVANKSFSEYECAAKFLAVEQKIPFAKNINQSILSDISKNADKVNWKAVWQYYRNMGFKTIIVNDSLFVFHWGDAE